MISTEAGAPLKLHAKNVSIGEAGDEYFEVSFDSEVPSDDDFDLSGPHHPYLIVQRQFEDDDGGVCYIETHDHDTYAGHFRLKLIEPIRRALMIACSARAGDMARAGAEIAVLD